MVYVIHFPPKHNYAQDAARPLENELIQGGAAKQCSLGDPGMGPDNTTPGYEGRYEFNGTKDDAVKLITKVATDNGYSLTYAQSPYSYIAWYSDGTSKKSTYPGFTNGNITISFNLYNGGKLVCGSKLLQADSTHTAISFGVGLPSSK